VENVRGLRCFAASGLCEDFRQKSIRAVRWGLCLAAVEQAVGAGEIVKGGVEFYNDLEGDQWGGGDEGRGLPFWGWESLDSWREG